MVSFNAYQPSKTCGSLAQWLVCHIICGCHPLFPFSHCSVNCLRQAYSPHSADFTFSALPPPPTNFILRRRSRRSSTKPPRDGQQGGSRGGRLSYGCIYKTHSFPIMLVSISMCVFSMILKYRTLYSKSKMSLKTRSVSWSFVCQFIIDMLFAPSHDDTEQFVIFHHYTLGPHERMDRI